jgi:hypothetical protein
MRSILIGILVLSALIVVLCSAGPGRSSATDRPGRGKRPGGQFNDAMKKIDENLKKKLQGICRGC